MRLILAALLSSLATLASAGGIDRNGQPITFIFDQGTVFEAGFGSISPSVSGNDAAILGGAPISNIGKGFQAYSFSVKADLTDQLSFGVLIDQPFGAEIEYGPGSAAFGGTSARADLSATTALLRYKFNERFSVHGGFRVISGDADVSLTGGLYAGLGLFDYTMSLDRTSAYGYVVGAAYEIPEYFLRVSLTYSSEITQSFPTTETNLELVPGLPPTFTPVTSTAPSESVIPQTLNLEFQSGIAPKTFVFGGARWAEWSKLRFDPPYLLAATGRTLIEFEDTITYQLGIGRQLNENWTGLFSLIHEPGGDPIVSPLAPVNGFSGATAGLVYTKDNLRVTGFLNYTKLGNATPGGSGVALATFENNHSVGGGIKIGITF